MPIDPHVTIAIHTIECEIDPAPGERFVQRKRLAVPSDATRQEARSAGIRRAVGPFDRPVVRQVEFAPPGGVETGPLGARRIAFVEPPPA